MLDFLTLKDLLVVLAIAAIGLLLVIAVKWAEKRRRDGDGSS